MTLRGLLVWLLLLPAGVCAAEPRSDLRELPKDLWGAVKEEAKPEGLLTLLAAGGMASAARFSGWPPLDDYYIERTLNRNNPLGGRATRAGALIGYPVLLMPAMGLTYLTGRYFDSPRAREFGLAGFEALSLAGVQTAILKLSVNRLRPDRTDRAAFPSGHSSASFALATVAASTWGWKVGVPACLAASFVGYTRMEGRSHYFSDVLFGAGIGIVSGRAVYKVRRDKHPEKYAVAPFFSPNGGGVTVAF